MLDILPGLVIGIPLKDCAFTQPAPAEPVACYVRHSA